MPEWGFLIFYYFLEFSNPGRVGTEFGTNIFFFSFSAYLSSIWIKILREWGLIIFWILFFIFFGIFLPGSDRNEILDEKFSLFLVLSHHSLDRKNARMKFFNFLKLFDIFLGIFLRGSGWNWFWDKIFSLFLGLSKPGLGRNNFRLRFFNFLNFLANFLRIFLPGSGRNGIWNEIFLFSLSVSAQFG